jgi:hypothetical protein
MGLIVAPITRRTLVAGAETLRYVVLLTELGAGAFGNDPA